MSDSHRKVTISECPRCRGDHPAVVELLVNPPADDETDEDWTYWAQCPTTDQPLFIAEDDDGNLTGET